MSIFPSDSSWGSVYSVFGIIVSIVGINKLTKKQKLWKRIAFSLIYFIVFLAMLMIIDYIGVITIKQAPRFSYLKSYYSNNVIEYKAPFYTVYRLNHDTPNEYYIIDTKNKYSKDTIPNIPFNRTKSGIDNIIDFRYWYFVFFR